MRLIASPAAAERVLVGEVLGPQARVTVLVSPSPLRADRSRLDLPAGDNLADMVALAWPDRGRTPCVVRIGEHAIDEGLWPRVRPRPGAVVTVQGVPRGKGALRSIGQILVAVAAIAATVFLGPIIGPFGAALVAAAVTIGGNLLINALFPLPKPKPKQLAPQEDVPRLFSVAGAQNQAKPFGSIPVVLGRHRIAPPLGGAAYTELVGSDQYVRMLLVVGYGPLKIEDIKIGETPIGNFADCQIEVREGREDDAPTALYATDPYEESLAIELVGGPQNFTAEWTVRQTPPEIDEISWDITAPEGIYGVNASSGAYEPYYTSSEVQIRLLPDGSWQGQPPIVFTRELGAGRQGGRVSVPRGQYEVRLRKQQAQTTSDQIRSKLVWSALRAFRLVEPVTFDAPLARIALRMRATDQLNGVPDQINVVASSYALAFDGSAWVANQVSRNPADLFRLVLQHPGNKSPVPDAGIDLGSLEEWWVHCRDNGFTYDTVVEEAGSVYDRLASICAAGRAAPVFRDGRWGVIYERFDTPFVQHFTPRNTWNFAGERTYRRMPHALRCRFVNAARGFVQDERIVYADGYDESNATLFETLDLGDGLTDSDLVWRHGRYHLAQAKLRPETYTFSADWEAIRCQVGDRVLLSHDVALVGQISARVTAVDAGSATITLDESVIMQAGKAYALRVRLADGALPLRSVETDPGEHHTIVLTGSGALPAVGDLVSFGEADRETIPCRVKAIEHQADLVHRLTLVDDAPAIATADTGPIPAFDSRISVPLDPYRLSPQDLAVKEMVIQGTSGASTVRVRMTWRAQRFARVRAFQAQIRDETAGLTGESGWGQSQVVPAPQTFVDIEGLLLGAYSFRVRSLFDDGTVSDWTTLLASQITGIHLSSPLPDITRLRAVYVDGVTSLTWDEVDDYRQVFYEVRKGDSWETALLLQRVAHPPFATFGNDTYWIAAVSQPVAGLTVYSATPRFIAVAGARLVRNVVAEWDERASGWTGVFTGSVAVTGGNLRTGGSGDILQIADFLAEPSLLDYGGGGGGFYEIPADHYVDVGRVAACAVTCDLLATGSWVDQNILAEPDFLALSDVLGAEASRFIEAFVEIAIGLNDPTDLYTVSDVYEPADIYTGAVEWSPWQKFAPGSYVGRHFKFRLVLRALEPRAIANVLGFRFVVDMPDRVDHYADVTIPAGGLDIVFWPDGAAAAAPFNGGPNGASVPYVNVTWANEPGDQLVVTGLTQEGVTVAIVKDGVSVERTASIDVQGY